MILTERARGGFDNDDWTNFSGAISVGGTAQALLPQQQNRVAIWFANNTAAAGASMMLAVAPPPVTTITLTSGVITAFTVSDNGLGWVTPPQVVLLGGIFAGNWLLQPGSPNPVGGGNWPGSPAVIQANAISGGALNGFTIVNGGSGYKVAPQAKLVNPWPLGGGGAATPSATQGIVVPAQQSVFLDSSVMGTGAINIFCSAANSFTCYVMLAQ